MQSKLKTDVEYQHNINTNENIILSIDTCKQYLLDKFELRNNIINSIKTSNIAAPKYHIIISYYNQYKDRNIITKKHRFIRNQFEEIFNPRYRNQSDKSSMFFLCETHKTRLTGGKQEEVKNTITNVLEYDEVNKEVENGSYHSHILKSEIPDSVILGSTSKIRKLIKEVFDIDKIDANISPNELDKFKIELIKGVCRRCDGIGNSKNSIKVVIASEKYYYDDYYGWEGFIAYTTKKCYNPDMMVDVVDNDNSSLSLFPARKPIKEAQKRTIIQEVK